MKLVHIVLLTAHIVRQSDVNTTQQHRLAELAMQPVISTVYEWRPGELVQIV